MEGGFGGVGSGLCSYALGFMGQGSHVSEANGSNAMSSVNLTTFRTASH